MINLKLPTNMINKILKPLIPVMLMVGLIIEIAIHLKMPDLTEAELVRNYPILTILALLLEIGGLVAWHKVVTETEPEKL